MTDEHDLRMPDGRSVRFYDAGKRTGQVCTLFWQHGTPQTGRLLKPVVIEAVRRGIRVISCARPGYPGSSPLPGRVVADVARDVIAVADALDVQSFVVAGASGGGPHALACAALAQRRVRGVVTLASIAPYTEEIDWFAGMASPGGLRAARLGRTERARYAETAEFDPASFTNSDWRTLDGTWTELGEDAQRAEAAGGFGEIDDDVAYVSPWGFDLDQISAPVLVVQGGEDRVVPASHGRWMSNRLSNSELWLRPHDGHVSVLDAYSAALDWLVATAA